MLINYVWRINLQVVKIPVHLRICLLNPKRLHGGHVGNRDSKEQGFTQDFWQGVSTGSRSRTLGAVPPDTFIFVMPPCNY